MNGIVGNLNKLSRQDYSNEFHRTQVLPPHFGPCNIKLLLTVPKQNVERDSQPIISYFQSINHIFVYFLMIF